MKNIVVIIVATLIHSAVWAQDYKPMLDTVNEWQFLTCFNGNCDLVDMYFTDGDTIVNNKSHKILDGFHYISREFLLREEVTEKKVYLTTVIGGIVEEFLLYDFNLEVGDEFQMTNPYSPFPQDGGMFLLYDIQELPLEDGELYKHYFFTPSPGNTQSTWEAAWVEGVGSLSIVTAPGGEPNFDNAGALCCSFANGENIYSNLERIPSCDALLGSDDHHHLEEVILLSETDHFTLKNATNVTNVRVYDFFGRTVYQKASEGKLTIEIPSASLKQGLYIIVVTNLNDDVKTFKVVR